ncbi:ABC transporter permease [Candidatus Pseudoscillospira sp. SGI.172]|uniref:ABC transporter permease n=1 Tax=Candidatus Pseudoscillospira sp. SGI.172 TaxID=3420582 RepID=UPI0009B9BF27|nr:ABC transporter permease [Pseudoflavonifractor sp.]MDY3020389.1 ABC transporter permease [Oscillospiraceae bacterium]
MRKYVFKRIVLMFLLLLGMSFIVFASLYIAPGDPATMVAGVSATEEDIAQVRASLGLDKPFLVQYLIYLKNLVTLDLGTSYTTRQPILNEILVRLPNTLNLACASMILAVLVGIPAGILTALKKDKLVDNVLTTGSLIGISIPNFLLGTILMYIFSVVLKWLPSGGMTHYFWTPIGFKEVILPAIALSTATVASFTRIGRSAMLDVLQSDYIRTAKSKGLKRKTIIGVHALRNALIPLVTQFGTSFGGLLGGAIITEQVFVINGIGTYLIKAINNRDYPVVQSTVLVIAAMFILINLLVDLFYCVIDPRIKYE